MNIEQTTPPASASTTAPPTTKHSGRASVYSPSTSAATSEIASTAGGNTTTIDGSVDSSSPNSSTASVAPIGAMATPGFLPPTHAFRSALTAHSPYASSMLFDREAARPVGTPFSSSPSPMVRVLIRRLPLNTSEESLRLMVVWSKELADVELLPIEQSEDAGFRSALLKFRTMTGANEAKNMLDGRSNISNDAEMSVDILPGSPVSRRYPSEQPVPAMTNGSSASSAASSRQASRFNNHFQSLDNISPPGNGIYPGHELPNPDASAHYQNLFSPQSPIGNHLMEHAARISGKTLIANDSADDDETSDLLKDPVAYAENGATTQRRATAPQIPIGRMAGLSLSTNGTVPSSLPPYIGAVAAHPGPISPMNGAGSGLHYPMSSQPYQRQNFPPVNPADQNPPCNTLYVGNLPIDTSEEELKAMFSKQRGYKRLCFRTKQNGPMCFVEFEDVSFATKALHELYGQLLHNSVKGGIRLSFSKNPLGVRSGQTSGQSSSSSVSGMNGLMAASVNGFTTASGPPPGLSAPPGLGSGRGNYHGPSSLNAGPGHAYAANGLGAVSGSGWNGPPYNGAASGLPNSVLSSPPSGFLPPHMMGR